MKLFSIGQMPIKAYIDGYIFDTQNSGQIKGIGGRITMQPTRYLTFEFKNAYDNLQHNVFMGGIKLYLNGLTKGLGNTKVDSQGIKTRLYEPIERNLANIGNAATTPYAHGEKYYRTEINRGHIIFVRDPDIAGLEGDGTYETPFIYGGSEKFQDLVDAAYAQFADYSYLYFAPGAYDMGTAPISFYSNQAIMGRSADFVTPAVANEVTLVGGVNLANISNLKLSNFQLLNREGAFAYGIEIDGAATNASFTLSDLIIGENTDGLDPANNGFAIAVYVHDINTGSATFTINDSSFYGIGSAALNISGNGMLINNDNAIDSNLTLAITDSNFYGFYSYTGHYPNWSSGMTIVNYSNATTSIANITNSKFISDGGGLDFEGESDNPVSNLIIGNITNSSFIGDSWGGIYMYHYNPNIGNIIIGDINNSYFISSDSAIEIYSWQSSSNVIIGEILNSNFIGDSGWGSITIYDVGNVSIDAIKNTNVLGIQTRWWNNGLYIYGDGDININIIENSTFDASGGSGWGIYAYATNITIGNIIDSKFLAGGEYGLFLAGIYHEARGTTYVSIGNIINSTFISGGGGAGLWIEVENANIGNISNSTFEDTGTYSNNGNGLSVVNWQYNNTHNLKIGTIENSAFTSNGSYGCGFHIGGGNYESPSDVNVQVDNVINSTFIANGANGTAAYFGHAGWSYYGISFNYYTINSASIGNIQGSIFNAANSTGKELWLNANQSYYGDPAEQYTDGQALYNILDVNNDFGATSGKYVCIVGSCYPA